MKESTIALQRDAEVFGGYFIAAIPLLFELGAFLGENFCQAFHRRGDEAIGLTHQDLEVTDGLSVLQKLQALKPDWVINTSAYNRVDDCEINPGLAFDVNALGAFPEAAMNGRGP